VRCCLLSQSQKQAAGSRRRPGGLQDKIVGGKGRVTRIFGARQNYYRTVIFALHSKFRASHAHQIMLLLQFSVVKILLHHTGSLAVLFFWLGWTRSIVCSRTTFSRKVLENLWCCASRFFDIPGVSLWNLALRRHFQFLCRSTMVIRHIPLMNYCTTCDFRGSVYVKLYFFLVANKRVK
jgi:hypothetical protein